MRSKISCQTPFKSVLSVYAQVVFKVSLCFEKEKNNYKVSACFFEKKVTIPKTVIKVVFSVIG